MFRPLPFLTAATVVALAILIGLGTWQLQRRAEKHALLDQIGSRDGMPPAPIDILLATGDYAAFRHAIASGAFDHGKETYVYAPRSDGGPTRLGKKVITPFRLVTGETILVDRGWVPMEWPDVEKSVKDPEGEVVIEGTLRPPSRPATFTPPADNAHRLFYIRDSTAIAAFAGVTVKSKLILELTKRDGDPEPLLAEVNIPDNHLNYAITWFSLAVVLLVIYLRYHYVRGRLRIGR
jgi:surfeit locus 1 family protein